MIKDSDNIPSRYENLGFHGGGGFGYAYLFKDIHLERKVIVKTISSSEESLRHKDEINALSKITSNHVVKVYDVLELNSESLGIVMEYIEGEDLSNPLEQINSSDELLKVLWQVSSGINDIHNCGVIHRDIKHNNMKFDSEGILKIFDFGLSRNEGIDAATIGFKGTLYYAAPETLNNSLVEFTSAIDVYSYGILSLHLIGYNFPIEMKNGPPDSVEGVFACKYLDSYPEIQSILEQCLSSYPSERPKISEVKDVLQRYLLYDKHKALLTYDTQQHTLDKDNKRVKLNLENIGGCEIHYNGNDFIVKNVTGEVYINNNPLHNNFLMEGSTLISIGSSERSYMNRIFITFDISNPEVVI